MNLAHVLPPAVTGGVRPGDNRFETVTARRPVLEAALATVAGRTPGVTLRRGVQAVGLTGRRDVSGPQITGVHTRDGGLFRADLVVDASGRRSTVPAMLTDLDVPLPPEEREEAGFVYYARHFRTDGDRPPAEGLLLQHFHGYSVLTLPADAHTWGVGFVTSSRDRELLGLREVDAWTRAMQLVPTARHWIEAQPISDIQVIAGIGDRYRPALLNGRPVCTGLVTVGDAWASTNPSVGRGAAIGLLHAIVLRDVLRDVGLSDPLRLTETFGQLTESAIKPWYRATRTFDRHRLAEINADLEGITYRTVDPGWSMTTSLYAAALRSPDALRAQLLIGGMLATPPEALATPGLVETIVAVAAGQPRYLADAPRHEDLAAIARTAQSPLAPVEVRQRLRRGEDDQDTDPRYRSRTARSSPPRARSRSG
jgi:2-polyprenyl-6-methoxyphenol hydroxylase-like FAD-dependent oxidoreductase